MAGENSVQLKCAEPIIHHGSSCFRCITFTPVGHADPVAKFSATVVRFDHQPHAATKRAAFAQAIASRTLLPLAISSSARAMKSRP